MGHKKINSRNNPLKSSLSKYKKVNNNKIFTGSNSSDTSINKPIHREILNNLLTKRLETANESNKQIVFQPSINVDCCQDFIPLSLNSDSSSDIMINQIMCRNQNHLEKKSFNNLNKKKFFIIDNDEEKIFDYLNSDSKLSRETICRPKLKIIPDFLI